MSRLYVYQKTEKLVRKYGTRDPFELLDAMHVQVRFYFDLHSTKGFSRYFLRQYFVGINGNLSPYEQRIVAAHELGHIFLGHLLINAPQYRTFKIQDDTESEANVFARDLLAPACVLHELQVISAAEISKLCNISLEAATYREKRMRELELRNAWYLSPLEKEVREQFDDFIRKKKAE